MREKRLCIIIALIFTIFISSVNAAIIHGTLYDIELNELESAIVEINTIPKQQKVAKNGTYFFNINPGNYTIIAKNYENNEIASTAEENITIKQDGEYVIDLILFPNFEVEEHLFDEADFNIDATAVDQETNYIAIFALLISLAAFFFIVGLRGKDIKRKKEEIETNEEIEKVIEFIKKEGGRTTQKDIRQNFPQSEAKISLIITELESEDKIKKIKKGRGNVIILK